MQSLLRSQRLHLTSFQNKIFFFLQVRMVIWDEAGGRRLNYKSITKSGKRDNHLNMKSIILCALILGLSVTNLRVNAQSNQLASAAKTISSGQMDTLKKDFNLKKGSAAQLVSGKSPAALLAYYEFYLQEKDWKRADSVVYSMLKSSIDSDMRYQISLTAYKYTADTKTGLLFLAEKSRVNEFRAYFSTIKVSSLKSNGDKWAHYYNLVALDSAYHQSSPDSSGQKKMADHYNSLAWYSILNQKLSHVAYYLNQSMMYDPRSKYPYANMPLLLLLQGRYEEAKKLYIKYKDLPFDGADFTFKDEFLVDFKELAAVGITNKDIQRITDLLNKQ